MSEGVLIDSQLPDEVVRLELVADEVASVTERGSAWWRTQLERVLEPLIGRYRKDDPAEYRWYVRHSANLITMGRGLLTLLLVYCMGKVRSPRMRLLAGVAALLVAALDLVDGGVARLLRIVSTLGKALDPLMDKLWFVLVGWAIVRFHGREEGCTPKALASVVVVSAVLEADVAINGLHEGYLAAQINRLTPDEPVVLGGATSNGKTKMLLQVLALALGYMLFNPRKAKWTAIGVLVVAIFFSRRSNHDHREEVLRLKAELARRQLHRPSSIWMAGR